MSSFRVSPVFIRQLKSLETAVRKAANESMEKVVKTAEKDAKRLYRWRRPGTYTESSSNGEQWTWEVTGTSAESITGYVVGKKNLRALSPGQPTEVTRETPLGGIGSLITKYTHVSGIDPSLTEDYAVRQNIVRGVVTMYTTYALYLQAKEINGASWGIPSAGFPVTQEVFEANWLAYYVPRLVILTFERIIQNTVSNFI